MALLTGTKALDRLLQFDSGIVVLRSPERRLLDNLCREIIWRNATGKELVLQFTDYHDRYWAIDIEDLVDGAKSGGVPVDYLMNNVSFLRIFTRDGVEVEENWDSVIESSNDLKLVILDSVSDLFPKKKPKEANLKGLTYMLGKFASLCNKNNCLGVALDRSEYEIHPFLGEIASAIFQFGWKRNRFTYLLKHPMLAESRVELRPDHTLNRWMV